MSLLWWWWWWVGESEDGGPKREREKGWWWECITGLGSNTVIKLLVVASVAVTRLLHVAVIKLLVVALILLLLVDPLDDVCMVILGRFFSAFASAPRARRVLRT